MNKMGSEPYVHQSGRGPQYSNNIRIHDDRQITSLNHLEIGETYQRRQRGSEKRIDGPNFIFLGPSSHEGWIDVMLTFNDGNRFLVEKSLADLGIHPYKKDVWNNSNYVIPIKI